MHSKCQEFNTIRAHNRGDGKLLPCQVSLRMNQREDSLRDPIQQALHREQLAEYIAAGHYYTRLLIARHQALVAQAKAERAEARRQHRRKWAWLYLLGIVMLAVELRSLR